MKKQHDFPRFGHQGDVLIIPLTQKPELEGFEEVAPILAHGETTGHKHQFPHGSKVRYFRNTTGRAFFLVEEAGQPLEHDEHATHMWGAGWHEVRIQREADLEKAGWRTVTD